MRVSEKYDDSVEEVRLKLSGRMRKSKEYH